MAFKSIDSSSREFVEENGSLFLIENISKHTIILKNQYNGPLVENGQPKVYLRTNLTPVSGQPSSSGSGSSSGCGSSCSSGSSSSSSSSSGSGSGSGSSSGSGSGSSSGTTRASYDDQGIGKKEIEIVPPVKLNSNSVKNKLFSTDERVITILERTHSSSTSLLSSVNTSFDIDIDRNNNNHNNHNNNDDAPITALCAHPSLHYIIAGLKNDSLLILQ